ncbi:Bug family tripartite tricarboxylate transporter substrate binding protein [Roseomonas gilardii]|uniref:Bug family tripartite tricarboxylate transporter substrate binding protein n=1 Tax=Roseomonas gilardii TaxID=257708 RepID=UPI00138E401A|nr:tripartite tricarboxylate transporter substrate binding protein [Roseomonas gilardii]
MTGTRRQLLASVPLIALEAFQPAVAEGVLPRRVTLVTPYGPGSAPDLAARVFGEILSRRLNVPTVVENRAGANGNIGTLAASRAAPNGETLLSAAGAMAISPSLYRSLGFDPITSFDPIVGIAEVGFVLIVNVGAGRSLEEFLDKARRSNAMRYGTAGVGSPHHLGMELLRRRFGFEAVHVPYRSSPEIIPDLLAGRVDAAFVPVPAATSAPRDGRLYILASASRERLPSAPDVPTMAEAGVPDYLLGDWYAAFTPAGTPSVMLDALNRGTNAWLRHPDVVAQLAADGMTPWGGSPQALRDRLANDIRHWAGIVRDAGITPN